MDDKEFRHLSKSDLIDIIYEMKKTELELRSEVEAANEKLENKTVKLEKVGSIAEAVVKMNSLFETAQKTADEYLERVYIANADIEERCRRMELETELRCREREKESDRIIAEKLKILNVGSEAYRAAYNEIQALNKEELEKRSEE